MYDHMTIADFTIGDRVELHPAHALWMQGARYGTVTEVGKQIVHVKLDVAFGTWPFAPTNLRIV